MRTMGKQKLLVACLGVLAMAASALRAQSVPKEVYDFDFIGKLLPDPVLQHAKETYVLFGCAYCHGVNLEPRGEATDLMHSKLVGRDTDGKMIVALLKAGIPQTAKLSPMPQFSDLSDQQLNAIALWIHYARAEGRFKELLDSKDPPPGDVRAGEAFFAKNCGQCHSVSGDLAGIGRRYVGVNLKAAFLKPKFMNEVRSWRIEDLHDRKKDAALQAHRSLLENYSQEEASSVAAYLAGLK